MTAEVPISKLAKLLSQLEPKKQESNGLAKLYEVLPFTMTDVKGKYYLNKKIKLDGFKFIACRFDNCSFYYDTSNFVFDKCVLSKCTVFHPDGAIKSIKLFNVANLDLSSQWPDFCPSINSEGTISIL